MGRQSEQDGRPGSRREFLRRLGTGGAVVAASTLWMATGRRGRSAARRLGAEAPATRLARIIARYGPELGRRV
jgi:hypothetical protein